MDYLMDFIQLSIFLAALVSLSVLLGNFFYKALKGERNFLSVLLYKPEKFIYKILRIDPEYEMNWKEYASALMISNLLGIIILVLMQITQQHLPLNPQHLPNVEFFLALNTAISFVTNTNWQSYSGEVTLSNFVQMLGLAVQNFISPAVGIAVLLAVIRGVIRRKENTLGNYWVDLTRSMLYVLLPLAVIVANLINQSRSSSIVRFECCCCNTSR